MSFQDMLNLGGFRPFSQTGLNKAAVYLGFNVAPEGAPVKLLMTMRDSTEREGAVSIGSILTAATGKPSTWSMKLRAFCVQGSLPLWITGDLRKQLFGEEYYWIRIIDESDFYSGKRLSSRLSSASI